MTPSYPRNCTPNEDLAYAEKVYEMLRNLKIGEEVIIAENVKEQNRGIFLRILIDFIQNEMGYTRYFDLEIDGEMDKPETHTKFRKIAVGEIPLAPKIEKDESELLNELKEIEDVISQAGTNEIQLNQETKIKDLKKFADSHLSMVRSNLNNPTYIPYLNRLRKVKDELRKSFVKRSKALSE